MNRIAKHTRENSDRTIIDATDKHMKGRTIVLEGEDMKQAKLKQKFQDDLDAAAATAAAKAQYQAAVIAERETAAETRRVKTALIAYLIATYDPTSEVLVDFGCKPRKAPKTKPAVKAEAIKLSRATREARHTMGKRQRAKIVVKDLPPQPAASAPPATTTATTTLTLSNGATNGAANGAAGHA